MHKKATPEQIQKLIARFAEEMEWTDLDEWLAERAINFSRRQFGPRFLEFFRNSCRFNFLEPKTIQCRPFDPAKFFGQDSDYPIWKGDLHKDGKSGAPEIDNRIGSISVIEISRIRLMQYKGGQMVNGKEKLEWLKEQNETRLGANAFLGFLRDYYVNEENSAVEWYWRRQNIKALDFPGTVFRHETGNPFWLRLIKREDGVWVWDLQFTSYGIEDNHSACYM